MSKLKQIAVGIVLGGVIFLAMADMITQSTGAKIFVYQGF